MSVFTKYSTREIQNLERVLKDKHCLFRTQEPREILLHFFFIDKLQYDIFYKLFKLKSRVYYEYSKTRRQIDEICGFTTTLFFCWPDLRRFTSLEIENEEAINRIYGNPVFSGIIIPSCEGDESFLNEYHKAINNLITNGDREPAPFDYVICPMLTFKNLGDYPTFSFVTYYGQLHHDLNRITRYYNPEPDMVNIGYLPTPFNFFGHHNAAYDRNRQRDAELLDWVDELEREERQAPEPEEEISLNDIETFEEEKCALCLDVKPNIMFCNCGHICVCESCFKTYNKYECLVCRKISINIRKMKQL